MKISARVANSMENEETKPNRGQLQYPLDNESKGALRFALEDVEKDVIRKRNRFVLNLDTVQNLTSFDVGSDYMVLTGDTTLNITTIRGGREGQILTLQFNDSDIVIVNDSSEALNTINTSAAFISSPNNTMQLLYDGTSWREISRSLNDTV